MQCGFVLVGKQLCEAIRKQFPVKELDFQFRLAIKKQSPVPQVAAADADPLTSCIDAQPNSHFRVQP